jgi:hypothetical protein
MVEPLCACYLRAIARLDSKNITTAHKNTIMFMKHKRHVQHLALDRFSKYKRLLIINLMTRELKEIHKKKSYCYSILAMRFFLVDFIQFSDHHQISLKRLNDIILSLEIINTVKIQYIYIYIENDMIFLLNPLETSNKGVVHAHRSGVCCVLVLMYSFCCGH